MSIFLATSLIIAPQVSLIDEPLSITASGLAPYQEVIIRAQAAHQKTWGSYICDQDGNLDLAQAKPKDGSYKEIDGMGLLCSMSDPCVGEVVLSLESEGKELERQTILRHMAPHAIQKIDIRQQGLTATLFIPDSQKPVPVIIYLSGSNGGLNEKRAKYLAAHGFASMALAYFAAEGLSPNLERIPLEFFDIALTYLNLHPRIEVKKIGLYGVSRGAELSLLLGTYYPNEIAAIAVTVPTSAIYGGLSEELVPAWLWRGEPLSFARCEKSDPNGGQDRAHPLQTTACFLKGMENDPIVFEKATILVEKLQAPLLLISGGDDKMWPSSLFAEKILKRLEQYGSSIPRTHLYYAKAGHGIGVPYQPYFDTLYFHPIGKQWFEMGGTFLENEMASRDSWVKMLRFFEEHLKNASF